MTDAIRIYDLRRGCFCDCVTADLVVALGNFDGVHIAHQTLLGRTVAIAKQKGTHSAAWCFDPPSSQYLGLVTGILTTSKEKLQLFAACGLDYVFLADFSALRALSPEAFVRDTLVEECHAAHAVCGFNYRFGNGGSGTEQLLRRILGEHAVDVIAPQYVTLDEQQTVVSSTAVRAALTKGDVHAAATLLGRPYSLTAPVVHGKQLGRTIGLPTVNQNIPDGKLLPLAGIYASRVRIGRDSFFGVTNIGHRPTVDGADAPINCETHILDMHRDLYGEILTIEFCHRLRDERRFDSVDELKSAVLGDIEVAKAYFNQ